MRSIRLWSFVASIWLLLAGCGGSGHNGGDLPSDIAYAPIYALGFEIFEGDDAKMVVSLTPWQGADSASATSLIIGEAPNGYKGQAIKEPAKRIACMSSTHVAMLDALGLADRVVAVSGMRFITNPYVLAHKDEIADIGYDSNFDYEKLVAVRPDLVLLYGVNGPSVAEAKLRELGIPFAYLSEYIEPSPLGKAEWLVALAEITGCRQAGEEVFAKIPERYDSFKALAATASERPKVMINTPYGDFWHMASSDSYVGRLIDDAGGDYLCPGIKGNESQPIDMEQAFLLASQADKWINTGQCKSKAELLAQLPRFAKTKPVAAGEIYNSVLRTDSLGRNDYWETGAIRPDLVLQDLVKIFHPELLADSAFAYYKKLE